MPDAVELHELFRLVRGSEELCRVVERHDAIVFTVYEEYRARAAPIFERLSNLVRISEWTGRNG